jgi:hypothetical protein
MCGWLNLAADSANGMIYVSGCKIWLIERAGRRQNLWRLYEVIYETPDKCLSAEPSSPVLPGKELYSRNDGAIIVELQKRSNDFIATRSKDEERK